MIRSKVFQVSELPEALNHSLDELFEAIEQKSAYTLKNNSSVNSYTKIKESYPDECAPGDNVDEFKQKVLPVETRTDSDSIKTEFKVNSSNYFPIGPREYWALRGKYGPEQVHKVTTTPAVGTTGDYDVMMGRLVQIEGFTMLRYAEQRVQIQGMPGMEGVYLVEGTFIKSDLFFVSKFIDLESDAPENLRTVGG